MSRRLTRRELALEKIGICASTFDKLIREGVLPKGTPLTPSNWTVGWYEDVIDAYVEQCRNFPRRRGDPSQTQHSDNTQNGRTQAIATFSTAVDALVARQFRSRHLRRPGR
jgi:predicted DNA-binding transcriptional regulator AlpA